jgi:hypothetical protein
MSVLRNTLSAFVLTLLLCSAAHAQFCDTGTACVFPPGGCAYLQQSFDASYPGGDKFGLLILENSSDCGALPADGVSDVQTIHAYLIGRWTPNGGSWSWVGGPVVLTVRVLGGPAIDPRPFDLELLAMDLTGVNFPAGVRVRERPSVASPGQGQADDQGGGLWRIESFFDVFTELSLDGGQLWSPSVDPVRIELAPSPPLPARPATWGAVKATYR